MATWDRGKADTLIENPILDSPYREPSLATARYD